MHGRIAAGMLSTNARWRSSPSAFSNSADARRIARCSILVRSRELTWINAVDPGQ
jgi:hypothetical protein